MLILCTLQSLWWHTARNDKFHRPIIDQIGLVHAQLCPWVFKAATATKLYYEFERPWDIISMLKSLQKQLQRRHKQRCLKIRRYTSPKIDVFLNGHLMLLAPTGNDVQVSFLVHQVPRTSATVLQYCRMFTQFSLRTWASEYTCRPIIANLL